MLISDTSLEENLATCKVEHTLTDLPSPEVETLKLSVHDQFHYLFIYFLTIIFVVNARQM